MCDRGYLPPVWANEKSIDYYNYTLRNGQKQFTSEYYDPEEFIMNKPALAQYYPNHQHKNKAREKFYYNSNGEIEIDNTYRDETYDFVDGKQSEMDAMFLDILNNYPEVAKREEINKKIQEIEKEIPQGIPMRNSIIDTLVRDYVVNDYKKRFVQDPAKAIGETLAPHFESVRDRLDRMTQYRLSQDDSASQLLEMRRMQSEMQAQLNKEAQARRETEYFSRGGGGAGGGSRRDTIESLTTPARERQPHPDEGEGSGPSLSRDQIKSRFTVAHMKEFLRSNRISPGKRNKEALVDLIVNSDLVRKLYS